MNALLQYRETKIFDFTALRPKDCRYFSLKFHVFFVCYLACFIDCLYPRVLECVKYHSTGSALLPASCSPFYLPQQPGVPSQFSRTCGSFVPVKIRPGGCFLLSPCGVLQSFQSCLNTSLREFSPENTVKFEWTKNSSVGHVADFCSVFQDLLMGSQFNFIIYKYKHYRWQKRILQVTSKILTFDAM